MKRPLYTIPILHSPISQGSTSKVAYKVIGFEIWLSFLANSAWLAMGTLTTLFQVMLIFSGKQYWYCHPIQACNSMTSIAWVSQCWYCLGRIEIVFHGQQRIGQETDVNVSFAFLMHRFFTAIANVSYWIGRYLTSPCAPRIKFISIDVCITFSLSQVVQCQIQQFSRERAAEWLKIDFAPLISVSKENEQTNNSMIPIVLYLRNSTYRLPYWYGFYCQQVPI